MRTHSDLLYFFSLILSDGSERIVISRSQGGKRNDEYKNLSTYLIFNVLPTFCRTYLFFIFRKKWGFLTFAAKEKLLMIAGGDCYV